MQVILGRNDRPSAHQTKPCEEEFCDDELNDLLSDSEEELEEQVTGLQLPIY
jgi:hypothetical protein